MKRSIDIAGALLILIIVLPIFILLCLLIWIDLGSPVFFIQKRPGRHNKAFKMIKFRTMRNECDKQGNPLPDQLRTTTLGRFIRRTSLDELPEFYNVLIGDMSLVGPRPLLMKYLPYYTQREIKRHDVRPGVTGLAQVNGRNLLPWNERLEMDVQYVENRTIWLDLRIILLTIINVIRQKDVLAVSSERITDFDVYRDSLHNV